MAVAAVTGATGLVGRFVVERLLREGVQVRAWRRPSSDVAGLPPGIAWVDGALEAPNTAAPLLAGADMLVHCALDHVAGRYRDGEGADPARHLRVNVGGSLALLAAARQSGVRRSVVLSSRAVFGDARESPLRDTDRPRPDTIYGASKAALESFVAVWGSEGWPVAALRPTGIYGIVAPVEKSKWFDLVGQALRGEAIAPRAGTEVHGRDVAAAVWRLLTADPNVVAGRMFNCSDIVVATREIVALAHRFAGMSGPLPDPAPEPRGVMECAGLQALGVRFGGQERLEETVAALVAAHRAGAADGRA